MDAVCAAIQALHGADGRQKEAESWLLGYRNSHEAWTFCFHALFSAPGALPPSAASGEVQLFAAQMLRHKLNTQGRSLDASQMMQLRDHLLQLLAAAGPHAAAAAAPQPLAAAAAAAVALETQLCLSLCAIVLLMPAWQDVVQVAWSSLGPSTAIMLLELLAEEAGGDMRHVTPPPSRDTGSGHLEWGALTRSRIRAWAPEVCSALLQRLEQHLLPQVQGQGQQQQGPEQQQPPPSEQEMALDSAPPSSSNSAAPAAAAAAPSTSACTALLSCLAAWVKLGALHEAEAAQGEQVLEALLLALQHPNQEIVEAAAAVMVEVPEYCPEPQLQHLRPSMAAVSQGACHAALAGEAARAAAWVRVFAAYASAQQGVLLSPSALGAGLRDLLLQVASLPQLHEGSPIALPVLEVWAVLEEGEGGGSARGALPRDGDMDDEGAGARSGSWPELASSCQQLLRALLACWLAWRQAPGGEDPTTDPDVANALNPCISEVMRFAARGMGASCTLAEALRLVALPVPEQAALGGSAASPRRANSFELEHAALWRQQLQAQAARVRAESPAWLRLHAALMVASACAPPAHAAEPAAAPQCTEHGGAAAGRDVTSWQRQQQEAELCGQLAAQLLAHAAEMLQHLPAVPQPGAAASSASHGAQQPPWQQQQQPDVGELTLAFCEAVCVWAAPVLVAAAGQDEGRTTLATLLQLVLAASAAPGSGIAAARAAKALLQAALRLGLGPLHLLVPPLMGALATAATAAAEQDLLVAISAALAAHWQEREVCKARADTVRQLLEPLYVLLTQLNAQLAPAQGAAQPWATLAPWADPQLTHHLTKVRVLLDAMSLAAERAGGSDGGGSGGGVRTDHEAAAARAGSGAAAAPAGDERMERESSGSASPPPRTASGRASSSGGAGEAAAAPSSRDAGSGGDAAGSGAGSGSRPGALEQQHGPVLRLIMAELWPQLHALCSAGASGRFLHALAKCCSAVLRSPGAGGTQPVLEQLLPLCAACFARPGGACLAEPLAAAVEMVGGGGGGLSGPLGGAVVRVLVEVWEAPPVRALQQPGSSAGDQRPDLAEHYLKLATCYLRHGLPPHVQPGSTAACLVEGALSAGAACACCCHRKVAAAALTCLAAVLAAATGSECYAPALGALVLARGQVLVAGLVGSLLAPSPLPRVHKVSAVLLDLASLCQSAAAAPPVQPALQLRSWLTAAVASLPPGVVAADEARTMAEGWAALLGQQHARTSRSYLSARRLKRLVREFAELAQKPQ